MAVILWIAALVLLIIGEAITVGLTFIWFAVGAAAGLVAAVAGASPLVQFIVFLAVSALALVLIRPLARKHLNTKVSHTNADRVIGQIAVVTEQIDNIAGQGTVKVAGQEWSARSQSGAVIAPEVRVKVLRIEGVKLYVEAV